MGLFSKLRAAPAVDTTLAKAVVMPAVLTMVSDGDISDGEIAQLQNVCAFSPIFAACDSATLVALIKDVMNDLKTQGAETVTQNAKATMSMQMRETALLFAMRIALADGRIDDGEQNVLIGMGERFEIPQETFMKMFDVVAMLQRRPDVA